MKYARWGPRGEVHERDYACSEGCQPVVVIDPEDREAVERLTNALKLYRLKNLECDADNQEVIDTQAALREYANPKPKREWRDGDVVQSHDARYTAQRHRGQWHTTTGGSRVVWVDDDRVTEWVETGHLLVLREQAAE